MMMIAKPLWIAGLVLGIALAAGAADKPGPVLENDRVRLDFALHDGALVLAGWMDKINHVEFIETAFPSQRLRNLWQVSLRSPEGFTHLDETEVAPEVKRHDTDAGQKLVVAWRGIPVEDEQGADVVMEVFLPAGSSFSEWRISVENRHPSYGVWMVQYPYLNNLGKLEEDGSREFVAIPGGNGGGAGEGQLHRDPFETMHPFVRTYPCYHQSMQFNAYYGSASGLYLAVHDPESHTKGFLLKPWTVGGTLPVMSYEVQNYPADCGEPGVGFQAGYPAVMGPFTGDWYDAARVYRAWALRQRWAAKGPLTGREDISPWIREGAYWMVMTLDSEKDQRQHLRKLARTMPIDLVQQMVRHIDVEVNLAKVTKAFDYFGYPMLLWCNEWFDGGGDTSPPRYIPVNNLETFLTRLRQEVPDGHLSAHIQPKRFSVQVLEYDDTVRASLETTADGAPAIGPVMPSETYDQHAYPCWATPFWQSYWAEKAFACASLGLDGFHVDELGSATSFSAQCFNREHDHPIGGGTLYVDTRRNMTTLLRENARRARPDFAIHHEVLCEIYIDVADAAEVCTMPSNVNIPMYEAVYHDYNFIMGRRILEWTDRNLFPLGRKDGDEGIDEFVSAFAQTYIWGNQPGWTRIDIMDYAPRIAGFIKRFMDARYRTMKFLNVGDMMRPLEVAPSLPTVERTWRHCDTPDFVLPVVYNSVWKAEDGAVGIVLANITDTPQTIAYRCDLAECGLGDGPYRLTRVDGEAPEDLGTASGPVLEREDRVNGYDLKIIEIEAAAP